MAPTPPPKCGPSRTSPEKAEDRNWTISEGCDPETRSR